jgi:hypothetical protein
MPRYLYTDNFVLATMNLLTKIFQMGPKHLFLMRLPCSADTFVVNQTLVLRINICGENRHLRQARNRWL